MLSTISIASLGLGNVAYAQDEAPQAEEATEDENVIIVTATKREQTLEEVPISVFRYFRCRNRTAHRFGI